MNNQQNKLSNIYPMFTNVLSFWITLVPSLTHRPAGNCCTRPPNTSLRNSILLRYGWMIGPKTSYEIDSLVHTIVFFQDIPLWIWSSLSNLHTLGTFLENKCHWNDKPSLQTLCFEYFHFHCFCIGIPLYILIKVSENSKMVLKAVRWSLPILIFWRKHFSIICQVWLQCLQSRLSSDNEIEINIHEELDLHIACESFVQLNPLFILLMCDIGLHRCLCFFFRNLYFDLKNFKWLMLLPT